MAEEGTPRLLRRLVAESHFEAMTIYNRILGREPYESDFLVLDTAPYTTCPGPMSVVPASRIALISVPASTDMSTRIGRARRWPRQEPSRSKALAT